MVSPDAAGVGPQLRCFKSTGLTRKGTKKWARDKEAEHDNTADEKIVHPCATDEGNEEWHGKQPDNAIRIKLSAPGRPDYAHEAKEDFYPVRQLQCSPERPDEGKRASRSPDDGTNPNGCC